MRIHRSCLLYFVYVEYNNITSLGSYGICGINKRKTLCIITHSISCPIRSHIEIHNSYHQTIIIQSTRQTIRGGPPRNIDNLHHGPLWAFDPLLLYYPRR
jgi:hypothetical protein